MYLDDDTHGANELVFIDERKDLIQESNCCGRTIFRMSIILIVLGLFFIWFQDYVINKGWQKESYVWVLVFISS